MTKYTDEGLVTDDAVVAAMFWGTLFVRVRHVYIDAPPAIWSEEPIIIEWRLVIDDLQKGLLQILIPYPLVKEAIQPVEGEGQFYVPSNRDAGDQPIYVFAKHMKVAYADDGDFPCALKLAVNPLTTGKTVGELRELVERVEGV